MIQMLQLFVDINQEEKELEDIWYGMLVQIMDSNTEVAPKMEGLVKLNGINVRMMIMKTLLNDL